MAEKNLSEVPRDVRELYQKGTVALQRQNFEYAMAIFNQALQREPGLFECRQALRAAQFKQVGGSTNFFKKMIGGASSSPLVAKAQMVLGKTRSRPFKLPNKSSTAIRKAPPAIRSLPKRPPPRVCPGPPVFPTRS